MSIAPTDQRDLIEPLFAGLLERPPWQTFLHRLTARTGAERAGLRLRGPGGAQLDRWGATFEVGRSQREARLQLGSAPMPPGLRALRVYTYAELIEPHAPDQRSGTKSLMVAASIAHGRWMRVPAGQGWDAWIMIEHSTHDFAAADSALLSALGPFIAAALTLLRELEARSRRAELAEHSLAALGVSQALLDRDRRVLLTDTGHLGELDARRGTSLQLAGARSTQLAQGMARLDSGEAELAIIPDARHAGRELLLRRAPLSQTTIRVPQEVLAITRTRGTATPKALATALAGLHGLSAKEAELAAALAGGEELVPAGMRLGLTPETTRNYSKRIYAKTGARGQADLVRLVLSGLSPLAGEI